MDAPTRTNRKLKISRSGKKVLAAFLATLLAFMMVPFIPGNPLGDYELPAYAYDSTVEELSIDDYLLENADVSDIGQIGNGSDSAGSRQLIDTGERIEAISLLVIADNIKSDETFDSMFADADYARDAIMGQYSTYVPVYDIGDEKYNVAYVGMSVLNNENHKVQDYAITENDLNAVFVDDAYYDYETGIVYVPKAFYEKDTDCGNHLAKVQMLLPSELEEESNLTTVNIHIENNNKNATALQENTEAQFNQFMDSVNFPLMTPDTAANISIDDITVYLNGDTQELSKSNEEYTNVYYDEGTGELTIATSPALITSVKVVIAENASSQSTIEQAHAGGNYYDPTAPDFNKGPWDMNQLGKLPNLDLTDLYVGQSFDYDAWLSYVDYYYAPASLPWIYSWVDNSRGHRGPNATESLAEYIKNGSADVDVPGISTYAHVESYRGVNVVSSLNNMFRAPYDRVINGVDFRGTEDGGVGGWRFMDLGAQCCHNGFGVNKVSDRVDTIRMRILYVDVDNEYCVIGFITSQTRTQSGVAVYRLGGEGKGYAKLTKGSANTQITAGNKQYDLAGAYYDVYSDRACTVKVSEIGPTNSNGEAEAIALKKGTYWVKERPGTAPKGYLLDLTPYEVVIRAGQETQVNVVDKPSGGTPDPKAPNAGFTIVKRDYNRQADGTNNGAQGAGSLQATFKVTYLSDLYNTVSAAQAAAKKNMSQVSSATSKLNKISYIVAKPQSDGTMKATFDVPNLEAEDSTAANPRYTLALGTYLVEEYLPGAAYKDLRQTSSSITGNINSQTAAVIQVTQTENGQQAHVKLIDGTNIDKTCITTTTSGNKAADLVPNSNDLVFTNLIPRGDISITKYGERTTNPDETPDKKVPLAGVQFQIVNDNDNPVMNVQTGNWVSKGGVVYTLTTDDEGFATTRRQMTEKGWIGVPNTKDVTGGALAAGNYLLREVRGPAQDMGYELMDPIPFSVSNNYQHVTMALENKIGTVVSIQKTDAETGQPVRGSAKFRILDSNKKVMTFDDFYPSSAKITTFTTGIDGIAKLPAKFMPGTYYIQEVAGPDGYVWSDKLIPFTCDSTTVKEHGEYADPMIVSFSDYAAKGQIVVTKTDSETDQPIISDSATFKVYAAEDIVTQDGTLRAQKGELVDTITTKADGKATTKELYLGLYNVVEEQAPEGYLLNTAVTEVPLVYEGDRVAVVKSEVDIADEPAKATVSVTKSDADSKNQIRCAGVSFDIRAAEDITGGDGYIWHTKGTVVDTVTTDENGVASSDKLFRLGKYELVEKSAPYGYVLDATPVACELKYVNQNTPIVPTNATVTNKLTACDLEISKLDRETGSTVLTPKCEVEIIANEDITTLDGTTHYRMNESIGSVFTDESGKATTDFALPVGKYKLREKTAPSGYVLDSAREYAVELTWDDGASEHQIFKASVSDMPTKGIITFTKADAETGKTIPVAGIQADVIANEDIKTGDGTIRARKDQIVAHLTTNEEGFAQTDELYLGSYRVVETFAPEGYLLNEEPVNVALVYENQNVPVVTTASQIKDENAKGIIEITKIDRETGQVIPLEGAQFEVRAKGDIKTPDGTVRVPAGELACDIVTTNAEGKCVTPELYLGTYSIIEVNAPYGYTLDQTPVDAVIAYKDQYTAVVTAASSVSNVAQKGIIQVTKTDAEDGLPILTPGAKFEITSVEDIFTADGTQRTSAGQVVVTIETDETGIAESPALYLGKYSIKEVTAPKGYLLSDEVKEVELVYGDQREPLIYEMTSIADTAVMGTIALHKEDANTHESLSDVVYEIRAKEDIVSGTGVVRHRAGETVETVTTDENGFAESGELRLGKYVLVETTQPNGYELDEQEHEVELVYADQVTPVVHEEVHLLNEPSSAKIKKVSLLDSDTAVPGTQFIGWDAADEAKIDAGFAIFANPLNCKIASVSIDYLGELSAISVDEDAESQSTFELSGIEAVDGNYQVWTSNEQPRQGNYIMHVSYIEHESGKQVDEDIEFSINEYDTNAIFAIGAVNIESDTANYMHYGKSDGIKTGDDSAAGDEGKGNADDAGTELFAGDDPDVDSPESADPDQDGDVPSLEDGTVDADGDDAADDDADSTTGNQTVSKDILRVPVILKSTMFAYSITGEDGICEFKYIPQGKVGFSEYKPADGYVSDRTPQYAVYADNGRLESTEINGNAFDGKSMSSADQVLDLVYADDRTKLQISKQDVTNSEELPGNTLSVYEANSPGTIGTDGDIASDDYGKLIETWTSTDEPHMMELLPQGTYILKEEQAVEGYTIAEDIKFQVNDTGVVQQVVMKNDHDAGLADELINDNPLPLGQLILTGDMLQKLIVLGSIVIASVLGVMFVRWRRRS